MTDQMASTLLDEQIGRFLQAPSTSHDLELLLAAKVQSGERLDETLMMEVLPYVQEYLRRGHDEIYLNYQEGSEDIALSKEEPPTLIPHFLTLDVDGRFLPAIYDSLLSRLANLRMSSHASLIRILLRDGCFNVSELGTIYRKLVAEGNPRAVELFTAQFGKTTVDAPLHLRVKKIRWSGSDSQFETTIIYAWDRYKMREEFERRMPELAGFPSGMQYHVVKRLGDRFPHDPDWYVDAF